MEESVTYQEILKQGKAEGRTEGRTEGEARALRRAVVALAERRLGERIARLEKRLGCWDAVRLDRLFAQVLAADTPAAIRKLLPR